MTKAVYRYSFSPLVPMDEIAASLLLAIWGAESLHGESQVRLDATHVFDRDRRTCVIDAGALAGRDVNRLFVGFLRREFSDDAFRIERIPSIHAQPINPENAK